MLLELHLDDPEHPCKLELHSMPFLNSEMACLSHYAPTYKPCWHAQARSQGAQPARELTEAYGGAHAPQQFHPMHQAMLPREAAQGLRGRGLPDLSRAEMGMYDSPLRHCERPVLQLRHPLDLQVQRPSSPLFHGLTLP